jgi:hypothetical protein
LALLDWAALLCTQVLDADAILWYTTSEHLVPRAADVKDTQRYYKHKEYAHMNRFVKQPIRVWLTAALLSGVLLSSCSETVSRGETVSCGAPEGAVSSAPAPPAARIADLVLPAPLYSATTSYVGTESKGQIVRLERDGKTRTIIAEEQPTVVAVPINDLDISPIDGSLVYALSDDHCGSLIQTDAAGKHRTFLFAKNEGDIRTVLGSPDGKTIAFLVEDRSRSGKPISETHRGIYVIAAGGGTPMLLQDDPKFAYWPIAWSPDGRRLLLGVADGQSDLAIKDLASGALLNIVFPKHPTAKKIWKIANGVWSPDGSAVYTMGSTSNPSLGLWRADATTGKTTPIIDPQPAPGQFALVGDVRPLSDGSVYAFLATTDTLPDPVHPSVVKPHYALVQISSDGKVVRKLNVTTYGETSTLWATDTSAVLITQHGVSSEDTWLFWQPLNGSKPTLLNAQLEAGRLHWAMPFPKTAQPPTEPTQDSIQNTPLPKTAQPPTEDMRTGWLMGQPCAPPCWEGITPGKTRLDEAVALLEQHPQIGGLHISGQGTPPHVVVWGWNADSSGGIVYYEPRDTENLEDRTNPIITSIELSLSNPYTLAEIRAAYGEPSHVRLAFLDGRVLSSYLELFYLPLGFSIRAASTDGQALIISPTMALRQSVEFFPPTPTDLTALSRSVQQGNSWLVPWQGFKDVGFYCQQVLVTYKLPGDVAQC